MGVALSDPQLTKLGNYNKLPAQILSHSFLANLIFVCRTCLNANFPITPFKPNSPFLCQQQFVSVQCSHSLGLQAWQLFPFKSGLQGGVLRISKHCHLSFSQLQHSLQLQLHEQFTHSLYYPWNSEAFNTWFCSCAMRVNLQIF